MGSFSRRIEALGVAVAAAALLVALALSGCASGGNAEAFLGTWDLQSGESSQDDGAAERIDVAGLRDLGLDTYLNLDGDGTFVLVTIDEAKRGTWSASGNNAATAKVEGQNAEMRISDDKLYLKQGATTLVFSKGDPKASDAAEKVLKEESAPSLGEEAAGLSETVVRGGLWTLPLPLIDDEVCSLTITGDGVDKWGDPGYNLQISNKGSKAIDVWVLDPFLVNGTSVTAYLFETVQPYQTVTAFIQFDTAELGTTSVSALKNVEGTVLVDESDGESLGAYPFVVR